MIPKIIHHLVPIIANGISSIHIIKVEVLG
ncbi:Uncharacterised protein [Mycobacteroides abscessus subsp. abscessus]|nr:Uncharacterised protein [Mycobacteroides abscessus subsp. abscessus]